ncbi:hypothetical protein C7974DRAFT_448956 [Boeremia exigua]|uniref:uncharacterized protein n=1 Tax=Boeremia exigua TaxID=749465 RepID=UPI001E8E6103|nr:uncharacterized protein C7974DRAFT_448956 [Boeremia exigua]KAH6639076.1 hypothetical protein C7974DRAFT_448956 [Boeremia exigua]
MSSTAPSAHDDLLSLPHRLPRPPHPHPPPPSTASTAYTGSFLDDGADLLTATQPGFGPINTRFYKSRRRHPTPHEGDEGWNADVARAVGGDVARCLAGAQALGEIWGRGEDGDDSADDNTKERSDEKRGRGDERMKERERQREERRKDRERRKRGVVTVPAPLHWGTFVIKSGDGRVVVVGRDGEWDSGPVAAGAGEHGRQQHDRGKETDKEEELEKEKRKREARLWIRAPSTPTASLAPSPTRPTNSERGTGRHARGERASSSASVSASTYTYDSFTTSTVASPLASQTQFFMTGGLGGWPESTATPEPESKTPEHGTKEQKPPKHKRTVPHAITWAETPMGGWGAAATATGKETEPWSPTPRRKHKARSLSTSTTRTTTPPLRPANAH